MPLNLNCAPYFGIPQDCWYPQFGDKVDPMLVQAVEKTFFENIIESQVQVDSLPPLKTRIRAQAERLFSMFAKFILIKDPNAILSADWLHTQFDANVLITIRYPAAVVSSIRNHPRGAKQNPCLYSAAIFWRLMHLAVRKYIEFFPNWTFVKYEDLASDPTAQVIELFKAVDTPFTESNKVLLGRAINNDKPTSHPKNLVSTNSINRDTERMKWIWKVRVNQDELALIRSLTEDAASLSYTAQDW